MQGQRAPLGPRQREGRRIGLRSLPGAGQHRQGQRHVHVLTRHCPCCSFGGQAFEGERQLRSLHALLRSQRDDKLAAPRWNQINATTTAVFAGGDVADAVVGVDLDAKGHVRVVLDREQVAHALLQHARANARRDGRTLALRRRGDRGARNVPPTATHHLQLQRLRRVHRDGDAPGGHLLHLVEAERGDAVDEAAVEDQLLAGAIFAGALDVVDALKLGRAIRIFPFLAEQREADIDVGVAADGAFASRVLLLPQRDVDLRTLEHRHVEGLPWPNSAGQPRSLPVLLPAVVHAADVDHREVLLDVVEGHPEDPHLVIHRDIGAVDDAQLEFHVIRPLRRVFPPIALPRSRSLLSPWVPNLHHAQLSFRACDLSHVQDAIGVRCLKPHLQDLLLRLLATLLGAAHAHEVSCIFER
mmetsp:Transcript_58469/g.190679  ORF Transcript_58469/g.190679 Transcript_58469/m.190679 type:complete len:414 (-) Transcript_58469:1611-2852(-)